MSIGQASQSREMPRYIGHKLVWALHIASIEPLDAGHRLTFHDEGYAPLTMDPGWVERHNAQAGGYLVQYEDGYRSWSPQQAFEQGYTPQNQWGIGTAQERKYFVNAVGRLANRRTGIAIPDDEPVFVFRGKDAFLPLVLETYAHALPAGEHRDNVMAQLRGVLEFQSRYAQFVRVPD